MLGLGPRSNIQFFFAKCLGPIGIALGWDINRFEYKDASGSEASSSQSSSEENTDLSEDDIDLIKNNLEVDDLEEIGIAAKVYSILHLRYIVFDFRKEKYYFERSVIADRNNYYNNYYNIHMSWILVVYCIENLFILCVLVMVWVVRKSISNLEEANLNLLIRYINRTMLEKKIFF